MQVSYVPVILDSDVIGYLVAVEDKGKAYFLRRLASDRDTMRAAAGWTSRLEESQQEGQSAVESIEHWFGAPPDPVLGSVAEGTRLLSADYDELRARVNPERSEEPEEENIVLGRYGSPEDPGREWDDPSTLDIEQTGYSFLSDGPVIYVPVTLRAMVLGYLWAADSEAAADYVPRVGAGPEGLDAGLVWGPRLVQAHEEGLSPLQALRQWRGRPEHPTAGGIAADAPEQEACDVDELESLARSTDDDSA